MPVNAILVACLGILGFAEPAIWLAGLGAEVLYLFSLATNHRFQHLIDAVAGQKGLEDATLKRQALVAQLIPPARRLQQLQARIDRIIQTYYRQSVEGFIIDSNRDALDKQAWIYLKLLIAQQYLNSDQSQATEQSILHQLADLEHDLADPKIAGPLKETKSATMDY